MIRGMQKEWISWLNLYSAIASNHHRKRSHKRRADQEKNTDSRTKAESGTKKEVKLLLICLAESVKEDNLD